MQTIAAGRSHLQQIPSGEIRHLRRILYTWGFLVSLIFASMYLLVPNLPAFLNLKITDIVQKNSGSQQPALDIVVVAIDEVSLKKFGQWPWSRYRLAQLLETINKGEPTSIGLNIIFPERDRTAPKLWQENLVQEFGYSIDMPDIPDELLDHDSFFAETIAAAPVTLGYAFLFGSDQISSENCNLDRPAIRKNNQGDKQSTRTKFYRASGMLCNHEKISLAAPGKGFLNGTPDADGIMRRLPLLIEFQDELYPSFALRVLMQHKENEILSLETSSFPAAKVHLAELAIPLDDKGNVLLSSFLPTTSPHLSAADVLEGSVPASSFAGKIVLVGLWGSGLSHEYATPMTPETPLLLLQKQAIESLAAKPYTLRNWNCLVLETFFGFLLCALLIPCIVYFPAIPSLLICLASIIMSWFLAASVYRTSGFLFSPLLPTMAILVNCLLLHVLKFHFFKKRAISETGEVTLLLQSSKSELQSIVRTIPDIIFRLDQDGIITFVSPAVSRYEKSPEQIVGQSIFDLVSPKDRGKAQWRMNERRTGTRATRDLEMRLLLAGETDNAIERFFSISAEGIYHSNESHLTGFIGTQGIIRDITDRKFLESQLIQAQKMEVVGNLASGIAHDLNNILSGLVSYPDLLLLQIPEDDPLHQKITTIQKSGKKAAAIVQDLLTLARRSVEVNDICNLNDIILDYLASIEGRELTERYTTTVLVTKLQHDLKSIRGSDVHLSKMIMNVCFNALEAMSAGGELVITTANVYENGDSRDHSNKRIPEGEYVMMTISDQGIGIPQGDLQRIFEPFYTRKSMGRSGSGLGMTIIWATVRDHGGYIDITSREGEGTTLNIYLPVTTAEGKTRAKEIDLADYRGTESILVVDDVPEQLELASNMLMELGYTVQTAMSGERAIAMLKKQPVDLLLLDMIMPEGMDGLETYQQIITFLPNQKAVIVSGFTESDRVQHIQTIGAGAFVAKPYSMENLAIAVRDELDRVS